MPQHEPSTAKPDADAAPRDMFSDSQIRMLKAAVIGMGAILLAGFALVIGRIIYLVNKPPPEADAAATAPSAIARSIDSPAASAPPVPLALPKGASVRHIALSERHLAVYFDSPTGSGLRLLNLRLGTWSAVIPLVEEKPAPAK